MPRSPRSSGCPAAISISSTITCSAIAASPTALFDGMRGMGRLWQAAGTVNAVLAPDLLEQAVEAGLRSLFVGFETLNPANLVEQRKYQNLRRDYAAAIRRLHDLGMMINGSFVFGMDGDDGSVFERTVEWAIEQGIETATFHILTPYPGTALTDGMSEQGRITIHDWDLYDTRHAVFRPAQHVSRRNSSTAITGPIASSIDGDRSRAAPRRTTSRSPACATSPTRPGGRSSSRCGISSIRAKRAGMMLPVLETILSEFGRRSPDVEARRPTPLETQTHTALHSPARELLQIQR